LQNWLVADRHIQVVQNESSFGRASRDTNPEVEVRVPTQYAPIALLLAGLLVGCGGSESDAAQPRALPSWSVTSTSADANASPDVATTGSPSSDPASGPPSGSGAASAAPPGTAGSGPRSTDGSEPDTPPPGGAGGSESERTAEAPVAPARPPVPYEVDAVFNTGSGNPIGNLREEARESCRKAGVRNCLTIATIPKEAADECPIDELVSEPDKTNGKVPIYSTYTLTVICEEPESSGATTTVTSPSDTAPTSDTSTSDTSEETIDDGNGGG
jgi:hypothetical protein